MTEDGVAIDGPTDGEKSSGQPSGMPVPGSPSTSTPIPTRRKRSNPGQANDQGALTLVKKGKFDKEIILHVLLPNATAFKFKTDAARIHSLGFLVKQIKETALSRKLATAPGKTKRPVEWDSDIKVANNIGTQLNSETMRRTMDEAETGSSIMLMVKDGHSEQCYTDLSMWNLIPKVEMLGQLPQGYTLETALADHVDNAIQAVWDIGKDCDRRVSIILGKNEIIILDNGRGMDMSVGNSLANWGTIGGSTHRAVHHKASGGKPPYLQPYFGKYGAGGVAAALHLGRCVTVWSKTKESHLVSSLVLDAEKLQEYSKTRSKGDQQGDWKTQGDLRKMTAEEREFSPHGSFTRVAITKLKQQYRLESEENYWKVDNVRQLLKDIYFPYIQTEEGRASSSKTKTVFPVLFEVNGKDLADVIECETAISNLHTCNGLPFVITLHFTRNADEHETTSKSQEAVIQKANAQISCRYYPILKGQEALETVADELKNLRPSGSILTAENMNRVTIRWLGKLLPEVKWPFIPFMEPSGRKPEQKSLRLWARRVRAFVDTDAGFLPVQSKTELDRDQPFAVALKELGSENLQRTSASGVEVSIEHEGEKIEISELTELYKKWLIKMHTDHDEEYVFPSGDEEATFIVGQNNSLKDLGIGDNRYIMIHTHMKDSKQEWKISASNPIHFKLCKGPGVKADKHVTLEYFYHELNERGEGFQVNFICRDILVDASEGCQLTSSVGAGHSIKLNSSEWFPASVLNTAKRLDSTTWKKKEEECSNKAPGSVEVLNEEESKKFDAAEAFPNEGTRKFEAGYSLPKNFLVVVRPKKGSGGTKQGLIVPESMVIKMVVRHCSCPSVKFCTERGASVPSDRGGKSLRHSNDDHSSVLCSFKARGTTRMGVKGLYIFNTESFEVPRLNKQGIYIFRFELESEKYAHVSAVSSIVIIPSTTTTMWTFCIHPLRCMITDHTKTEDGQGALAVRLEEPVKEDLYLQKYDKFGNSQAFEAPLEDLEIVCVTLKGASLEMRSTARSSIVPGNRHRLSVKDILFNTGSMKKFGSSQEALLRVVLSEDHQPQIKCTVLPGTLAYAEVINSEPEILMELMLFGEDLQPGEVIRKLTLQGLDACKNKVERGRKVSVILEGAEFQDDCGDDRVVDENGILQLGGLIRVTDKYNSPGSITLQSGPGSIICTINFFTVRRSLVTEQVPAEAHVGSQLEGIVIKMVDKKGIVDTSVNATNRTITADWEPAVTFRLIKGVCILPCIQMPKKSGSWEGLVSFSGDPCVCVKLQVKLKLGTACNLGPTLKGNGILAAECGVPVDFPFQVYDDRHNPAFLETSINAKFEAKESGGDRKSMLRTIPVENVNPDEDFKLSLVEGIPAYQARLVMSGPVGTYVLTMTDTSLVLRGKAEHYCELQHGPITQLCLERSDGTIFQYEETSAAACPVIGVKRWSPNSPELTVKLLDSHGNVCVSPTEERTLRVTVLECPCWKDLIIEIKGGVGKFKVSSLDVLIGRYEGLIELGRSVEELYSLEDEKGPVQAKFGLRVDHGNYPSSLRFDPGFDGPDPVTVTLTEDNIQHIPRMTALIDSADGLRLLSAPSVRLRICGDSFEESGPTEYLGIESPEGIEDDGTPSYTTRFEFTEVRVPSQTGTYQMDFILDGDMPDAVLPLSRSLIVCHGPPRKIQITEMAVGQEIVSLKLNVVDVHGNHCYSAPGLALHLDLTLTQAFSSSPGLTPCAVLGEQTALVEEGNGDFGVLRLSSGIQGFYLLKVSSVHGRSSRPLIPAEAQLFVVKGDINKYLSQLQDQKGYRQVMDDFSKKLDRCQKEILLKQAELVNFETKRSGLQAESDVKKQEVLLRAQHAGRDDDIIKLQESQPLRDQNAVFWDLKNGIGFNKQAVLAFLGAMSEGKTFGQQAGDYLGIVAALALVEEDSLNRILAEYLGPKYLTLIITRTQRAVDALDQYVGPGGIHENTGLEGYARSRGYTILNKFSALALHNIQPYGRVITGHSQRVLDIPPPTLPSGHVPSGFLGYAVNLLYLRPAHLQMKVKNRYSREVGLRESLFFHLLKHLQVYDTKHNMIFAKDNVNAKYGGAVSLDGGIIRSNQCQEIGSSRSNIPVRFALVRFEERRDFGGLMPPANDSFRRLKERVTLESDIHRMQGEMELLGPGIEEYSFQLRKLNRNWQNYEEEKKNAQSRLQQYQEQIVEVQKAANVVAARYAGTTRPEQPGGIETADKMRAFLV